jgi:hypothetical protein
MKSQFSKKSIFTQIKTLNLKYRNMKVIKIRLGLIRCKQLETAYEENKKYQILLIHISTFVSLFLWNMH